MKRREPMCPFCDRLFERPYEIRAKLGNRFSGGMCECGAVYVFDPSGHNLGEAYVDALNFVCEGRHDNPWDLIPGEDYEEVLLHYDWRMHSFAQKKTRASENIYFILLKKRNK